MIDNLDVRVPPDAPYHPDFSRLYSRIHHDSSNSPFRRSRHYLLVGDLRPYGYDVILNLHCLRGRLGYHKVELLDTGRMTFAGMVNEIERIFEVDATKLEVMRIDLAADVPGIPVKWFQERMKARYKQVFAAVGSTHFVEIGKREIQTLYFGKRPNLFRIYDKIAEYKFQYEQLQRKSETPLPSFEEMFGVPESGYVLTRVERQYGGGKIPEKLSTVAKLKTVQHFCPFDALGIMDGGKAQPNPDDYTFETYLAGMYLRHMADEQGMQAVSRHIAKYSQRNQKWAHEKFRDFLPLENSNEMVNTLYLNVLFRNP